MTPEETRRVMARLAHPIVREPVDRPCDDKAKYYSPREAECALKWLHSHAELRDRTPLSYYYCRWHDAYHLTHHEEVWS